MKSIVKFAFLLPLLVLACASTMGTKVEPAKVNQIEKGKTTEAEVIQMFGKPDQVSTRGSIKNLEYRYTKTSEKPSVFRTIVAYATFGMIIPSSPISTKSTYLHVQTENEVVKDFTYSEGEQKGKI